MLWITGANGLLGSAFAKKRPDAHFTGKELDIADEAQVSAFLKKHPEITHIINTAAFSQVDAAEDCREEAFRTNVLGPECLAKTKRHLIHFSTDYVFPGNTKRPLLETDEVGPCNYYGETKLEGEKRALERGALVIRTSWIFGQGGKNFASKLWQMLQTEKQIRLTQDQWGRFTYAPDLADAVLDLLEEAGLFHYANCTVATKYEFALAMKEEALELGFKVATQEILPVSSSFFPTRCKRPVFSALDTAKIEQKIPIRSWREALREFLCAQIPIYS